VAVPGENTIRIAEVRYLIVYTGGERSHLVREAIAGELAQAAIDPEDLDPPHATYPAANFDRAALTSPRWSSTTVCGRPWYRMAAGEAGGIFPEDEVVTAPDCRACLRLLDQLSSVPPPDPRVPIVTTFTVESVENYGRAEILNVSGDQLPLLRRAIIRELHARGHKGSTYVVAPQDPTHSPLLFVWTSTINVEPSTVDVFSVLLNEPPRSTERPWRIDWTTWAVE
jgi:hypothetical protein